MTIRDLSNPSNENTIQIFFLNATGRGFASRLEVTQGMTLGQLIHEKGVDDPSKYKITLNGVAETAVPEYVLREGDRVSATQTDTKGA